ncbi:MAG: peptide ABC transporter substrate-binding protein [Synergistaceae bacterium]|jgi:oligopeptide transport system substrate-binding protein|nr:peptide ABC transporter substrate-binding protein [Synergistaceae bacterium]
MNRKIMALILVTLAIGCASTVWAAPKVISYANGNAPPVLEPVMNNYNKTYYLINNIFTGLARIGKDGYPELAYAESYKASDDGLVYTFKLRPGAKYSDGSPLTARDWEESFLYKISPEIASPGVVNNLFVKNSEAYNHGEVSADAVGFKALDESTLQVTFTNPTPYFMNLLCYYIPYKMDIVKNNPDWFKKPETYIGNGPFRVKKLDPQVGFVLEKNPNYYDAENVIIDEVDFNFIDDVSVALEAYRKGELNVLESLGAEAINSYNGTPELVSFARTSTFYISVHMGNVPDARVRKALSLAINRPVLIGDILGRTYTPAEGIVPFGIHWGERQFREVVGSLVKTDIDEAKRLLEEAGYPGGKGLKPLRIITMTSQEEIDTAQAWQGMWKAIGIESEISTYEPSVYWDVFLTDNWDVARDGWTGGVDDPMVNFMPWRANKQGPQKGARWYEMPNAVKFETLMRSTDVDTDRELRLNLFMQAEKLMMEDMPAIPVWHGVDPVLIKPRVTGIVKSSNGHVYFNFADIKTD